MTEIILVVGILLLGLLFFFFSQQRKGGGSSSNELLLLQNQIASLSEMLESRFENHSKEVRESVHQQLESSQRLIKDITREIVEVKETNKQVFSFTESLQKLEKVLTHQKQRGNLGEEGLRLVLENFLPPTAFSLQYSFKDGAVCDAVIHTKNGVIPVDAKFSLDNYNRALQEEDKEKRAQYEREFKNDLKKRIDETSKYIRESDGTLPFALMYIPAEGIYYDLLIGSVGGVSVNSRDLLEYAHKDKKVIIVSPTTFVAYLHTILQGFRAFQIEERAKEIEKNVEKLGRHLKAYEDYHSKLGNSLGTVINHYNASNKELRKIDKDVYKIAGEAVEIEELLLDKPAE